MMSNDKLLSQVWDGTMNAIKHFNKQTPLLDSELIQNVINNNRIEIAKTLIK